MGTMLLAAIVDASARISGTRSRLTKTAVLAETLRAAADEESSPDGTTLVEVVASYLAGAPRQRRTGLRWRGLSALPAPATEETLTVLEVDAALEEISRLGGSGSQGRRTAAVEGLFGRATAAEQQYLRALVFENLRQGALDSVLLDAIARAAEVPAATVRRAAMFSAATGPVAVAALTGGAAALEAFRLEPGRPVRPMLASSAPEVGAALDKAAAGGEVAVDRKLDGIRIQVHRSPAGIAVFTRSLEEIGDRLPEVVEAVAALEVTSVVLDGEAIALRPDGRPRPFQETAARTASTADVAALRADVPVSPVFFDVLHVDGRDLLDEPARVRLAELDRVVPASLVAPRLVTADPAEAGRFFADTVAAGHEGVVVKALEAPYDAGRRGASWVKVKPRHTLDLVVLAVEWGSGRREGLLSNLHLGARDGDGWAMLGKTFKGMTDQMLAWQTERFLGLETGRSGHVVHVRPEQVVEIAFDGIQTSRRYPSGMALRFARVVRYRDDKTATEADTVDAVRALRG